MFPHRILLCSFVAFAFTLECPQLCQAQTQVLSPAPPNVEYQYQMYYPRWFGWPGPGLSLGGTLPTRGREGYSSFYGRPLPVPLGSGVFVNPYAYATQLPGFNSYGLAQSGAPANGNPGSGSQSIAQSGAAGSIPMMPPGPPMERLSLSRDTPNTVKPIACCNVESSETTLHRSREVESFGDEVNLRQQQWTQGLYQLSQAPSRSADARAAASARPASDELHECRQCRSTLSTWRRQRGTDEISGSGLAEFKQALAIEPTLDASAGVAGDRIFGPGYSTRPFEPSWHAMWLAGPKKI